jgi:hypothetical protein
MQAVSIINVSDYYHTNADFEIVPLMLILLFKLITTQHG